MTVHCESFCDVCGKKLDYRNESFEDFDKNIGWPQGFMLVTVKVGDMCKACAREIIGDNCKGKLKEALLKAVDGGQPCPLA